ncbi:MAG: FtsX-like permease family protein, partial [Oscillospiraceae bacterium]|nr:FtsX-like permease family protein [Oscillospiraceae bacterium]
VYGDWPQNFDEAVLFIDKNNELSDLMMVSLGLVPARELDEVMTALRDGEGEFSPVGRSWSYEELCQLNYKLILPAEAYRYDNASGTYVDMSATESGMELIYNSAEVGVPIKIVGIARPNEEATSTMITGAIGYTHALTVHAIKETEALEIVSAQLDDPETDVIKGLPFATGEEVEPSAQEKTDAIKEHLATFSTEEKSKAYVDVMSQADDDYVAGIVEQQTAGMTRESIEEMIVQQYAAELGVDADTIMGYISEMSDEELFEQVSAAIEEQVRQQYADAVIQQMAAIPAQQLASALDTILSGDEMMMAYARLTPFTEAQYVYLYDNYYPPTHSEATYEENLETLGYIDLNNPSTISIYATTFADKDVISDYIAAYNDSVSEEDVINYTDYVALLMSSITGIISGISYLLIAFVSISLIVSSIMIGVITLISVQERTKEIGILRAVGASKRDVSRVFNAETMIVGFSAGLVGIIVTIILIFPINAILLHYTGLEGLRAALPAEGGIILIIISALLTLIAGLIPSRVAAKKDPVEALRTE